MTKLNCGHELSKTISSVLGNLAEGNTVWCNSCRDYRLVAWVPTFQAPAKEVWMSRKPNEIGEELSSTFVQAPAEKKYMKCQCPDNSKVHEACGCSQRASYKVERNGMEYLVCDDCRLSKDRINGQAPEGSWFEFKEEVPAEKKDTISSYELMERMAQSLTREEASHLRLFIHNNQAEFLDCFDGDLHTQATHDKCQEKAAAEEVKDLIPTAELCGGCKKIRGYAWDERLQAVLCSDCASERELSDRFSIPPALDKRREEAEAEERRRINNLCVGCKQKEGSWIARYGSRLCKDCDMEWYLEDKNSRRY